MKVARATLLLPALFGVVTAGCGERSVTVRLRSLLASGEVTHVCRANGEGVPLEECNPVAIQRGTHDLYALVTQTSTGEVAIINVAPEPSSQASDEGVVDVDLSTPGFGFLRVGARPGDIVSTPGGRASFVASGEPGRSGIFALPTSCLGPPADGQPPRDLTTWAACSLPVTPGSMEIVIDRPDAEGVVYGTCGHEMPEDAEPPSAGEDDGDERDCPVSLVGEGGSPGRRKLLVALPDRGSLAIIDAQGLLDRKPGSFQACVIEQELPLRVDFPASPVAQVLPPDLAGSCVPEPVPLPPAPLAFAARPAGFSMADGTLYVADQDAPVVHVVDLRDACSPAEAPPLLPQSYAAPGRIVTTSRVAVSPLTPAGRRFVYAIDELDWPSASVMIFDVSPGSTDRTPLVRSGTPFFPYEPADRIQFSASARDLRFVFRDRPKEEETGVAPIGQSCDPRPDSMAIGASYRPNSDYSTGARALELRGVFALVMLSNGRVEVIDVEDFDAPCRRPVAANPAMEPDFRGCAGDPPEIEAYLDSAGTRTVTDEASCRIVEPHRARSAFLVGTSSTLGVHGPALRSFPQLTVPEVAAQTTRLERPKLLGVDFPGLGADASPRPATVNVGTAEYVHDEEGDLVLDPARATQHSVVLPFVEPRAYLPSERFTLRYEGPIMGEFPAGFFTLEPDGRVLLRDGAVGFCDGGVNDVRLAREFGVERFQIEGDALETFARRSTDHVVITADFPEEDDAYWGGASCDRRSCQTEFGAFDAKQLGPGRELDVLEAEQQRLWLEPRAASPELVGCCFPSGTSYLVRASRQWVLRGSGSGFRHDITATLTTSESGEAILRCVRDCHPRKRYFESRVFEISASSCAPAGPGEPEDCGVGAAEAGDVCTIDARLGGVELDEPAARCVHDTPTGRFVVYRGTAATTTDSVFSWDTLGGFVPLGLDLAVASSQVSPQELVVLPEMDLLSVVDASNLGLALLSLDRLSVLTPTFN